MPTQTINTVPSASLDFLSDLQNYLAEEDVDRAHDAQLGTFIVSGGIGPTNASLGHTITATRAYVSGYYVQIDATAHTYMAERRTFVYAHKDDADPASFLVTGGTDATFDERVGHLVFVEGSPGSAVPDPIPDTILLCIVDTDASAITSVSRVNSYGLGLRRVHDVRNFATAGNGTFASPWIGWEAGVNALPAGADLYWVQGYYHETTTIVPKVGWNMHGDGPELSRVHIIGTIKGVAYSGASLGTHANIHIHDIGFYGDQTNTQTLIELDKGFNFYIHRVYLFNSATNGLVATGFIGLDVARCNIEGNILSGITLGGADSGTQYANCWSIASCIFGSSSGMSSNGYVKLINASTGFIGDHATFEHGTRAIVLDGVVDTVIEDIFVEFCTEQCIQSLGVMKGVRIANSHLHTNKQGAAVFIDLSDGTDAHERNRIEDNRFLCFGGSGQSSFLLFHPGDSRTYRFWGNYVEPEGNRTILPVTYVFGYLSDDDAFFTKDVEVFDADYGLGPVIDGYLRFGAAGTAFLTYDRDLNRLILQATQASEELLLKGASSELLLKDLLTTLTIAGGEAAQWDQNATAGNTRSLVYDVTAAALRRIKVETADLGTGAKSYLYLE